MGQKDIFGRQLPCWTPPVMRGHPLPIQISLVEDGKLGRVGQPQALTFAIQCALGGGRTHTWRILSPLPLPLGYEGKLQLVITK